MTDSQKLLAEYAANGSEPAFRELVVRYVDLVHSTALRLVDGDAHRAQDVSQVVFADLARLASRLAPDSLLGGWLHRHTCYVARTLMRGERRRDARERQAAEMNALHQQPDHAFQEIAPVLDELINEMPPDDRDAILLRFFERRDLRSVGNALGINENVAQKRVARAVEELSMLLRRRGYTVPAAVLAGGLAANATQAAPLGLAIHLTRTILGHSSHAAANATAAKAAGATKLKLALVAAVVLAAVTIPLRFHLRSSETSHQPELSTNSTSTEATTASMPEMFQVNPPNEHLSAPQKLSPVTSGHEVDSSTVPEGSADGSRTVIPSVIKPPEISGGIAPVPKVRLFAKPGGWMRVSGTANMIHTHWQVESPIIGGNLDLESSFLLGSDHTDWPRPIAADATAFVAIRSLKSVDDDGKPYSDMMDNIMYGLLSRGSDTASRIFFHLTELRLEEPGKSRTNADSLKAWGELTVAGATEQIAVPLQFLRVGSNTVEIYGSNQLRMSTFNIHPHPRIFSDASDELKVGDRVSVQFKWCLQERSGTPGNSRHDDASPDGESIAENRRALNQMPPDATGNPSNSRGSNSRLRRN